MPFWNKVIRDENLFSLFAEIGGLLQWIVFATIPYTSSRIYVVSEGHWCNRIQKYMFAHCSVSSIFKCSEPIVCRNQQTADSDNIAYDGRIQRVLMMVYNTQNYWVSELYSNY
jgi:hypothetical protein